MNLRDLHYLVTVSNHLHFGKAAEVCNVSQPTLSMQLKKLEETLGVQLFERTNKKVMLTPIGKELAARAQRILQEAASMRELANSTKDPLAGDLKLGIFPTLAPYLLPTLSPLLSERLPNLNILLIEEKTPILLSALEEGSIDAALLAMPADGDGLAHLSLFEEPFVLAVSKGHRLAKKKTISLDDIKSEHMLLLEEGHCLRAQALELCQRIGVGEAQNFRATSLETLRHMVSAGRAITLMPALSARNNDAYVRYIPFKNPVPSRKIGLYFRKSSGRKKLFETMANIITQQSQAFFLSDLG